MHYGKYDFSKNGEPTILAINDKSKELGQDQGLSKTDADQLYKLYNCENTKKGWSDWSEWHPCFRDCKTKRTRFCYSSKKKHDCPGKHMERKKCTDMECRGKYKN